MRISEVLVKLTKDDLLDLLHEVITLKDLNIDNLEMSKSIRISGSFKKFFRIKFLISFEIEEVRRKILILKLNKVKVLGIPAIKFIRRIILRNLLKSLEKSGIRPDNDKVVIDLEGLLKDVKFLSADIKEVQISQEKLNITLQNVNVTIKELVGSFNIAEAAKHEEEAALDAAEQEMKQEEILLLPPANVTATEKIEDIYTEGRSFVEERLPEKVKPAEEYIFILPDIIALIVRLLKDERVSRNTKITVIASLGYIAVPTDFISDKIPFIGKIDDLTVALFALNRLISDVPIEILLENWQGNDRNILVLKKALEYLKTFSKANDLDKFYSFINAYL